MVLLLRSTETQSEIAAKFIDVIGDGETARDRWLFGPHCHCGCDCGCSFLNQPFVLALRNDSEATRFCVLPGGTKAIRIKLPRAGVHAARLCKRLTGHLAARRKRHFEFGTARR